jgi:hypothetical protein
MPRIFSRDQLFWDGLHLRRDRGGRILASIAPDARYPNMWRVRLPGGGLSDMVNISRARDAVRALALAQLNTREAA